MCIRDRTMAAGIISAMPGLSALSPLYLACVTAAIAEMCIRDRVFTEVYGERIKALIP